MLSLLIDTGRYRNLKVEERLCKVCDSQTVEREFHFVFPLGERGGSVVECRTPEREVGGSKPTAAVLCP